MFGKIEHTSYPPAKNILIWDGKCGFCKFWKTRWQMKTDEIIEFKTFQEISEAFPDIPLKEFKKASRLIETDGKVYSGPDSAYRSLWHANNKLWHRLYSNNNFFRRISDHGYNHIAKNREIYWKVTRLLFGKDPKNPKFNWIYPIIGLIIISIIL